MTTQLENLNLSEPLPSKTPINVTSASLGAIKRRFVISISLISLLGFAIALYQLLTFQIGFLEIGLFLMMSFLSTVGVTVGYHRHFAHKAFKAKPAISILLAILGSTAGHGSVISWVSVHRCHHQYSDQPGDPHSPRLHGDNLGGKLRGLWHAHLGWLLDDTLPNSLLFAKDLLQEPALITVNRLYLVWLGLGLLIPTVLGGLLTWSWQGMVQGLIWGGIARMFGSFHSGCTINSIAHVFGKTFLVSNDHSKNNWLLAIPTFGEGWHNNHHAFPHSARFGLKWWQIDLGYWVIQLLAWTGLAWEVKVPTPGMIEAKRIS